MAQAAADALGRALPGTGGLDGYVTDASRLDELAARFLGEPATFEPVDL
jgi:hypothetical protein